MPISRRAFLGCAAGFSTIGLAGASRWGYLLRHSSKSLAGCALVDPGNSCTLRESVVGYESALSALNFAFARTLSRAFTASRTMILPAALMDKFSVARVRSHLEQGSTVLFETGAAFLNAKEFDFQRRLIKSSFGLRLHEPIRLWESADAFKLAPYVDYVWPVVVKVRDFSRIVPVDCNCGETIAWFQKVPVAVKRRLGKGTLVFLGSPLGPHLLAGDREASNWLGRFCSSC